jgi:O-antigen/teichoic acid export membrane protein
MLKILAKNKLKSKLSWSLFGNIIYALSQWGVVTIIAKYGTSRDLGIYSIGLAVTAPIVLFFNFQLRTILATDSKNEYEFKQYYGGRIIHLTISFLIILPVSFIYGENKETIIAIILMGLVKYFESLSDIFMGLFQKKGRIDLIGKSQLFRGIFTVVIFGLSFVLTRNVILSVCGLLITMIVRFISYDMKKAQEYADIIPSFDSWLRLIRIALPLGIVSLINSLNTNIPRYLLDRLSSPSDLGIYSALSYVLVAANMLITPVSLLAAPKLADAYNNNRVKQFVKLNIILILFSTLVFIPIILILIIQGENVLKILYSDEYATYNYEFIIINCSMLFSFYTTFFNLSIVAARFIQIQPIINFIVTIISFLTSYFFINLYGGVLGASYSLLISRASQTMLSFFIMVYAIRKLKSDMYTNVS